MRTRFTAIGVAAAASAWSALTYEGPYRWLAELQLALFGGYIVQLTFLLTLLLCVIGALAVVQLARRSQLVAPASKAEIASEQTTAARLNERMAVAQGPLILFTVGAVLAFVGARDLWSAEQGRKLQRIDAAQLERGEQPASTWLELNGVLLEDGAVSVASSGVESDYVPLVSEAWRPGKRLGALLELPAAADPGSAPYRGAVDPEGLPGLVRAEYEKAGIDASNAVVLQVGKRPAEEETKAGWFLNAGLVIASVGGFVTYRRLARR